MSSLWEGFLKGTSSVLASLGRVAVIEGAAQKQCCALTGQKSEQLNFIEITSACERAQSWTTTALPSVPLLQKALQKNLVL